MSLRKLVSTVSVTGAGTALAFFPELENFTVFSFSYRVASGTLATISVQGEVSWDGSNWFNLGTPATTTAATLWVPSVGGFTFPYPFFRANVTVLTGTTPVIELTVAASSS